MDFLSNSSLTIAGGAANFFDLFYHSLTFSIIRFAFGVYAVVLLTNIVLLLIQRGVSGDLRDTVLGMNVPKEMVTKKNILKAKWQTVKDRMKSENESDYKVAIIEADNIIDDLIARMGYGGENMSERLDNINPGQIENIEELRIAHETRNRIIHDETFKLDKKEAEKIIGYFEEFLRYFEIFK